MECSDGYRILEHHVRSRTLQHRASMKAWRDTAKKVLIGAAVGYPAWSLVFRWLFS